MLTRWGRTLDPDLPLPEHPRPQLVRDTPWVNLNGRWEYAFAGEERPATWDGTIVVPFSPEAPLSGVGRQLQPTEHLWYRRSFRAPDGDRVLLHFGAVDQSCTVWVDGTEVGGHVGGYLPFTLDITEALRPGDHLLEVRVRDLSETGVHARGKQRLDAGAIWYTAQSGIWQTVWLEAVPTDHITALAVVPDLAGGTFTVTLTTAAGTRRTEVIAPADPRPWSPEDPFLHEFVVEHGADRVRTRAALREFGSVVDEFGRRRFTLNGEPLLHVGVLDQGHWPDGLMTPPDDAALVHDIRTMKDLGFTVLRKHAKIESLRWYHHCDRLGMIVWQDMVNGGGRYRYLVADLPARRPVRFSDRRYALFFRDDERGREEFREEVRRTVDLLRNVASIAVWTPFNEAWGQFDANEIAAEVASLDPTRLVNHVSGWIDQGGGDIRSHHAYLRPFRLRRRPREKRARALTEYGGLSLKVAGHHRSDVEFGYHHCETTEEFAEAFRGLHENLHASISRGLAATVYTQVSDVEDELNGLLTHDREHLKLPPEFVRGVLDGLRSAAASPPSGVRRGRGRPRPR